MGQPWGGTMTRIVSRFPLPPMSLGTERHLTVHSYGDPDARPKAYLQGGLHAGELPGPLALHHLIRRLDAAEDEIVGQIMLVPVANPMGQSQNLRGAMSGRYSLADGSNFNRGFPDLAAAATAMVIDRLERNESANRALMQDALAELMAAAAAEAETENDYLRVTLMRLACDADIVLDLHCEEEALMHLYAADVLAPQAETLAAMLDAPVTLLTERSGLSPFDDAVVAPWIALAAAAGDRAPVGAPPVASTVELRGAADVGDAFAEEDADRLYRYLQQVGVVSGGSGTAPDYAGQTVPVDGMDRVTAPVPGIISFRVPLGAKVTQGQAIADLIDPTADDPAEGRVELAAHTDGIVFARRASRFAYSGATVMKIAGSRSLDGRHSRHLSD